MLKRKALDLLTAWKAESNGSTAMLIEGARRVGKSYLAEQFGQTQYASYLTVDFSFAPDEVRNYFLDMRGDLDSFFLYLSAYYGVELHTRNSLIIFDEVQLYPKARESIKQLVHDGRYDFLETGSLMSIKENVKDILLPSEERTLQLQPLDFDEFLWALGESPLASAIETAFAKLSALPDALHRKAMRLFREYMLVGGMPQVVQTYVDTRSFSNVDKVKRDILKLYRDDIGKHAGRQRIRAAAAFDGIVGQLSKHEKKFSITSLGSDARRREYDDAFFWLSDAHITNDCFNATDPNVGLAMSADRLSAKCYMADTGLLVSHAFSDTSSTEDGVYRDILLDKLSINEGMLTENVASQSLRASGHRLFFYSRYNKDNKDERMEIDFLVTGTNGVKSTRTRINPIEIKSSKAYKTTSLDKFKSKFSNRIGTEYVVHPGQLRIDDRRVYLPLYMLGQL
jgi:predicted AAA+ superfamily ATPase